MFHRNFKTLKENINGKLGSPPGGRESNGKRYHHGHNKKQQYTLLDDDDEEIELETKGNHFTHVFFNEITCLLAYLTKLLFLS